MFDSSITPHEITGIVLAGGRSRRMGQDKALLRLNGQTLLGRSQALLTQWGCSRVCISGRYADQQAIPDAGLGPLSGILACLEHEPARYLLFIPVDMPFVTPDYLDRLLAAWRENPTGHGVSFAEARFPLLLANNATVRTELSALLTAGRRMPLDLYERVNVRQLPLAEHDRPAFDNTNTPEQWQAAVARSE